MVFWLDPPRLHHIPL